MLSRHLPLITTCIHFTANKVSVVHPAITHRISFAKEDECRDLTPSVHSISGNEQPNDLILDDVHIVDDNGESELSEDPEDPEFPATQIPKPAGEPGRPNSGGYSLEDSLAPWGREELGKVTVRTEEFSNNRAILELISNVDIHEEDGRPETRSQEELQQTRLQAS
jgi:hypothetical protein